MDHTRQFEDNYFGCRVGCEYCTDDAFNIDDLFWRDKDIASTDPREAFLDGNHAELYVEKVMDITEDRKYLHKKGKM